MKNIDENRRKFYEFLNKEISIKDLEAWIYSNLELEHLLTEEDYLDLISLDFKDLHAPTFIKSIIVKFIDWDEYERWRTIKLLHNIKNGQIEIVLATRKMRALYLEQEEEIEKPLISIGLAIGYESELENCPLESEYGQWNSESLANQLKPIEWYRDNILKSVKKELENLIKNPLV